MFDFFFFFLGILTGSAKDGDEEDISVWRKVPLFRGPLLLIIFLFLIGINIYGWRSSGVNHVLIFEIDPRNHLTEQHLIEIAAIFGKVPIPCALSYPFPIGMPSGNSSPLKSSAYRVFFFFFFFFFLRDFIFKKTLFEELQY